MRREMVAESVLVELDLPKDWQQFRLPGALHARLQELLDTQDREGKLSPKERREATAIELLDAFFQEQILQLHQAGDLGPAQPRRTHGRISGHHACLHPESARRRVRSLPPDALSVLHRAEERV